MTFSKDKRQETLIYLVLWGLLFIAPVLSLYFRTTNDPTLTFDWKEVLMVWRETAIFFACFLIHNYLLAPLLVYRQRRTLYLSVLAVLIALFVTYQCSNGPHDRRPHDGPPPREMADFERRPPIKHHPPKRKDHRPPVMVGEHDIVRVIILILMLLANLGIKLYFKQRRDQLQMAELEKHNLEQQLEYLKYQINPHFLMNTLNNIHALVDINPELAKNTILELSKLLRFVLYEGNKQTVPLKCELDFLDNYLQLMRLRYTNKVSISFQKPAQLPNTEVPPLMFITFVENAFKHGVSYKQESFIDITIETDKEHLTFSCRNSKLPKGEDKQGGVGLKNVKQRLELIYGKNFTLDIDDQADTYNILLVIPLSSIV